LVVKNKNNINNTRRRMPYNAEDPEIVEEHEEEEEQEQEQPRARLSPDIDTDDVDEVCKAVKAMMTEEDEDEDEERLGDVLEMALCCVPKSSAEADALANCIFQLTSQHIERLGALLFHIGNPSEPKKGSNIVKSAELLNRMKVLTCTQSFADLHLALMTFLLDESKKPVEAQEQQAKKTAPRRDPFLAAMKELAGKLVDDIAELDPGFLSKYKFLFSFADLDLSPEFKTIKNGTVHVAKWGRFERAVVELYVRDKSAFDSEVLAEPFFTAERVEILRLLANDNVRNLPTLMEDKKRKNVLASLVASGHTDGIRTLVFRDIEDIKDAKRVNSVAGFVKVYDEIDKIGNILRNYAKSGCKCDVQFVADVTKALVGKLQECTQITYSANMIGNLLVDLASHFKNDLETIECILSGPHIEPIFIGQDEQTFTVHCEKFNDLVNVISNLSKSESSGFNFDVVYSKLFKKYKSGPRE
jgi:hypothetical protein